MGRKKIPGLYKRHGVWHIDKQIGGQRLCESTGAVSLAEAERFLAKRLEDDRQARVYGVRPARTFREASRKYLSENQHKVSIQVEAQHLARLDPFIGSLPLHKIHMGVLKPFVEARLKQGVKSRTLNYAFQVVRRILNLAASVWIDEYGLTWLQSAPKMTLRPLHDARDPYPLSWEEQTRFFRALPKHLANMALFAVNTGCRDAEICQLQWRWEIGLPELPGKSVFMIPRQYVKNREDRLVVLNDEAQEVIEKMRDQHEQFVFTFRGKPIKRINNTGWKKARSQTGIPVRVHDLKHTLGRRLRAAGVSLQDCQDLLGHKSQRITAHYTVAEVENLFRAVNRIGEARKSGRLLTLLKRVS